MFPLDSRLQDSMSRMTQQGIRRSGNHQGGAAFHVITNLHAIPLFYSSAPPAGWYGGTFGEGGCILPCFDFCSCCYHAAWTFHRLLCSPPLDLAHFVLLDCSPKDPEPENCGESSGTIMAVAPCSFSCSVIWMDCLYLQLTG